MEANITIIAPIYNESENIPALYERVQKTMHESGDSWELIMVDDGSTDGSTDLIRELANKDPHVRPVIFDSHCRHSRNNKANLIIKPRHSVKQ